MHVPVPLAYQPWDSSAPEVFLLGKVDAYIAGEWAQRTDSIFRWHIIIRCFCGEPRHRRLKDIEYVWWYVSQVLVFYDHLITIDTEVSYVILNTIDWRTLLIEHCPGRYQWSGREQYSQWIHRGQVDLAFLQAQVASAQNSFSCESLYCTTNAFVSCLHDLHFQ